MGRTLEIADGDQIGPGSSGHEERLCGVDRRVDGLDQLTASLDLVVEGAASPDSFVIGPTEQGRHSRARREPTVMAVGTANCPDQRRSWWAFAQLGDRGPVASTHPGKAIEPTRAELSRLPQQLRRMRQAEHDDRCCDRQCQRTKTPG